LPEAPDLERLGPWQPKGRRDVRPNCVSVRYGWCKSMGQRQEADLVRRVARAVADFAAGRSGKLN
jgi:hypothetical protein